MIDFQVLLTAVKEVVNDPFCPYFIREKLARAVNNQSPMPAKDGKNYG